MELEEVHLNILPRVPGWDSRRFTKEHHIIWLQDGLVYIKRRENRDFNNYHTLVMPTVHLSAILPKRPPLAPWESTTKKRGRPPKVQPSA
tara:strand:+ start:3216 stop:3485 length:270 start_codon:yes stop_codon:yes gene_type:complete